MSNYKNSLTRSFGKPSNMSDANINGNTVRSSKNSKFMYKSFNNDTPGPGTYRITSEFGRQQLDTTFFNSFSESFTRAKSAKRSTTTPDMTKKREVTHMRPTSVENENISADEVQVTL